MFSLSEFELSSKSPSNIEEDVAMVERIGGGDEEALISLYDKYSSLLFSLAMRILRAVDDAQDILHDIFLELWNKTNIHQNIDISFYTWVITVTRSHSLVRKKTMGIHRQHHLSDLSRMSLHPNSIHDEIPANTLVRIKRELILDPLKKFNQEEQQTLVLAYYEGYNQSEIAKLMKVPIGVIKFRIDDSLRTIGSRIGIGRSYVSGHAGKFPSLCGGYSVDMLDGNDLKEFEDHLNKGCNTCQTNLVSMKEASSLLPATLPQIGPPSELRERIQFSIRLAGVVKANISTTIVELQESKKEIEKPIVSAQPKRTWLVNGLVIAIILLIVGFGVYVRTLVNTLAEQRNYNLAQQTFVSRLVEDLEQNKYVVNILKSPDVEIVNLKSSDTVSNSSGKIIYDVKTQDAVLYVVNLPPMNAGNVYQLWISKGNRTVSVGYFSVSKDNNKTLFKFKLPTAMNRNDLKEFFITHKTEEKILPTESKKYLSSIPMSNPEK